MKYNVRAFTVKSRGEFEPGVAEFSVLVPGVLSLCVLGCGVSPDGTEEERRGEREELVDSLASAGPRLTDTYATPRWFFVCVHHGATSRGPERHQDQRLQGSFVSVRGSAIIHGPMCYEVRRSQ
ncbi:uncharacterized protein LOC143216876 isoform X2 [Lasioglossum baleicum]|uniref:uncharacterized protein LOC143216876 isoform X2 n=1 Tax=Lasioglossum baleicum TaxID=434251 RepID=UPI003FCDF10A